MFVTVCAIALSSTQSRTVVSSDMLQERFLCGCFLPSVHHIVLCKDVLEKCVCIISGEWVYLIISQQNVRWLSVYCFVIELCISFDMYYIMYIVGI